MPRPKAVSQALDQQKVALYCRVSSAEQRDHGISLEAQEASLRAYCTMRNLEVVDVLIEGGVSGGTPLEERPKGKKIAEMIEKGMIGSVAVTRLDRAFRDTIDCLENVKIWDQRKVAFHALDISGMAVDTSSYMGRFFLTMIAAAAELERHKIRDRIRDAMAHMKEQGVRFGAPFLGEKMIKGEYVEDPAGITARDRVLELALLGYSRRRTAEIVNGEGHRTQRGGMFSHDSVQSVVNRGRMNGLEC